MNMIGKIKTPECDVKRIQQCGEEAPENQCQVDGWSGHPRRTRGQPKHSGQFYRDLISTSKQPPSPMQSLFQLLTPGLVYFSLTLHPPPTASPFCSAIRATLEVETTGGSKPGIRVFLCHNLSQESLQSEVKHSSTQVICPLLRLTSKVRRENYYD